MDNAAQQQLYAKARETVGKLLPLVKDEPDQKVALTALLMLTSRSLLKLGIVDPEQAVSVVVGIVPAMIEMWQQAETDVENVIALADHQNERPEEKGPRGVELFRVRTRLTSDAQSEWEQVTETSPKDAAERFIHRGFSRRLPKSATGRVPVEVVKAGTVDVHRFEVDFRIYFNANEKK